MTHIAEANDYRLATDGAVEVAGAEPPCLWCPCVAEQLERGRQALADVLQLRDELDEVFEKWNGQEEPCSKKQ